MSIVAPLIRWLKPTVNKVTSLRDLWEGMIDISIRRLKPAVNKVTSLRDFAYSQSIAPFRSATIWIENRRSQIHPFFQKKSKNRIIICDSLKNCIFASNKYRGTSKNPARHAELVAASPLYQGIADHVRNDDCAKSVVFRSPQRWVAGKLGFVYER